MTEHLREHNLVSRHKANASDRRKVFYISLIPLLFFLPVLTYSVLIDVDIVSLCVIGFIVVFNLYIAITELAFKSYEGFKDVNLYADGIEFANVKNKISVFFPFSDIEDIYILYNSDKNSQLPIQPKKLNMYGSALCIVMQDGQCEFVYEKLSDFGDLFCFLKDRGFLGLQKGWVDEFTRTRHLY